MVLLYVAFHSYISRLITILGEGSIKHPREIAINLKVPLEASRGVNKKHKLFLPKATHIPKYNHITGERAEEIANFIVKYLCRVAIFK